MDKKTTFNYFKELTKESEKNLKRFDHLTDKEFAELEKQAREVFNAQKVTIRNGLKDFECVTAFITHSDTYNGFYIAGADLRNAETGYKFHLIAFEVVHHYDFEKHERQPDTLRAIPIYKDDNETFYTVGAVYMDFHPLEKWQKELNKRITSAKNRAKLWQKVKRIYKKDGGTFANISKNFDGATVTEEYNGLKATVDACIDFKYIGDTLYDCEKYPLKNIDDVLPTIKKYINYLQDSATQYEKILKHSKKIYIDTVGAIYEKILKYQTPSNSDGIKLDYFYFTLKDILQDLYIRV